MKVKYIFDNSEISDIFVTMKTKAQFTYLDYLFKEMYAVKSKHYPDSTFFKNDDKVILELEKSGTLWVLYSVWSNISDMFSFDYNETQQLIKEWMEEQLKLGEIEPKFLTPQHHFVMEEQLKLGEIEPDCNFNTNIIRVQEELKSVEITPNWRIPVYEGEEELKSVEVTPKQAVFPIEYTEEVTPRSAIPPQSWTNLKLEKIKPEKTTCFIDSVRWKSDKI